MNHQKAPQTDHPLQVYTNGTRGYVPRVSSKKWRASLLRQMETAVPRHSQVSQRTISKKQCRCQAHRTFYHWPLQGIIKKPGEFASFLGISSLQLVDYIVLSLLIIFWYGLLFWGFAVTRPVGSSRKYFWKCFCYIKSMRWRRGEVLVLAAVLISHALSLLALYHRITEFRLEGIWAPYSTDEKTRNHKI